MHRREFVESHGATCANWTWSWSFVNHAEKFVIFGVWDVHEEGNRALLLAEDWAIRRDRRSPGYSQAREHLRLVEEAQYRLKTFPMQRGVANPDSPSGPAKILGFKPELVEKVLVRIGRSWYASEGGVSGQIPEEVDSTETVREGAVSQVSVNRFERNAEGRRRCLAKNGYLCAVCGFDFEQRYGPIGRGYIHVHHIIPLAEIGGRVRVATRDRPRANMPQLPRDAAQHPTSNYRGTTEGTPYRVHRVVKLTASDGWVSARPFSRSTEP